MSSSEIKYLRELIATQPDRKAMSLPDARAAFDEQGRQMPMPEGVSIEEADAGGVPTQWFRPAKGAADAALLYFHGGGFINGSPVSHGPLIAGLAATLGMPVLALHYRLAPEHPFPAAVEDTVAAYRWLLARPVAPKRIVIGGDSAGGGLTLAAMLAARERGLPLPAAAFALSPWVDLTNSAESYATRAAADPILSQQRTNELAAAYLQGQDARTPLASPLFADLAGLPPLLIHVGSDEVLLDDAVHLHARAQAAGVDAELEIWDEMIHVWHYFHPLLREGREALASIGAFVRAKISTPSA